MHFIPSEFRALCIPILEKFKQILPDIVYDSKCIIGRWPETHFLPPAQIRSIQNTRNTDWITGEVAFLIISRFFSWKKINKKRFKKSIVSSKKKPIFFIEDNSRLDCVNILGMSWLKILSFTTSDRDKEFQSMRWSIKNEFSSTTIRCHFT